MLALKEISYQFSDKRILFENLSLSLKAPFTIVRGPSGCGKTTLLKILFFGQEAVTSGKVKTDKNSFLVLQNDLLAPWLTGKQNLNLFDPNLADHVLDGPFASLIQSFVNQKVSTMSFGQRRSIELARALSKTPSTLLLDEPFNYLDRHRREEFLSYLTSHPQRPQNIIITSHYETDLDIDGSEIFEFEDSPKHNELVKVR